MPLEFLERISEISVAFEDYCNVDNCNILFVKTILNCCMGSLLGSTQFSIASCDLEFGELEIVHWNMECGAEWNAFNIFARMISGKLPLFICVDTWVELNPIPPGAHSKTTCEETIDEFFWDVTTLRSCCIWAGAVWNKVQTAWSRVPFSEHGDFT